MTSSPSLNRYTPHRWARVVSGETWAEYGLGPSGQIEAKTTRGPLIVWATKPGEGEDLPRLEAPTPSPLEVEAARLNMRPHFLAFVRCAQGRRKTKTGRRVGFLRLWRGPLTRRQRRAQIWQALDIVQHKAERMAGRMGLFAFRLSRTRQARRSEVRHWKVEALEDRFRQLAPVCEEVDFGDGEKVTVKGYWIDGLRAELEILKSEPDPYMWGQDYALPKLISLARALGDRAGLREALNALTYRRTLAALELAYALRFLEAAAFRAHVARRVRPPARRARIPRPIYARPRPPTAPTAPPVA